MRERLWRSVAGQMLSLHVAVVLVLVTGGLIVAVVDASHRIRVEASERSAAVATAVAAAPIVHESLLALPAAASASGQSLSAYAESVRVDSEVDFVVVMSRDRIRLTHPDPTEIGKRFVGHVGDALDGDRFTEEFTGTLGPSVRTVVPVIEQGEVIGMVAVGITVKRIDSRFWQLAGGIGAVGLAALAPGILAVVLTTRRLRRQTYGMDERELRRVYEYHRAVLRAVREGLVLLDARHCIELVNDEARRLLDLPDDCVGRHITDIGLPPALATAAIADVAGDDDVYIVGGNALVVSSAPAQWRGRTLGAIVTVRDRTELQTVSGELGVVRRLTDALRAQNHESANQLHTVISLVELGRYDEAIDYATDELHVAQLLTDSVVEATGDSPLTPLLLSKLAEAAGRGIRLFIEGAVSEQHCDVDRRDCVTVAGNLIDNAMDAAADRPDGEVHVLVQWDHDGLTLTVDDNGAGIAPEDVDRVLHRGWSTKAGPPGSRGIGLSLVEQVAERWAGHVDIGTSPLGGARLTVRLNAHDRLTDEVTAR